MRGKRQTRKKGTSERRHEKSKRPKKNHSGACSSRIPVPESSLGASRHRDDSSLRFEARKTARERKRKPASGAVDLASLSFSTPPEKGNARCHSPPLFFLSSLPSNPLSLSLSSRPLTSPTLLSFLHPPPHHHPHPRSSPSWPSPSPRPSSSATRRGGRSGSRRTPSVARPRRTCFAHSTSSRTSSRSRGRSTTGSCRSRPTAR